MRGPTIVAYIVAAGLSGGIVGEGSAGPASHPGLTSPRLLPLDHVQAESDRPRDSADPGFRGERLDGLFTDRDDRRRPRRERHDVDHVGHGGRNEWRDFDPRDPRWRSWGSNDGRGNFDGRRGYRGARGVDSDRRDYGGRDIDGPARGLGLPYWAPD